MFFIGIIVGASLTAVLFLLYDWLIMRSIKHENENSRRQAVQPSLYDARHRRP